MTILGTDNEVSEKKNRQVRGAERQPYLRKIGGMDGPETVRTVAPEKRGMQ